MKKIIAAVIFVAAVVGIILGIRAFRKSRIMESPLIGELSSVTWQDQYGNEPKNRPMETGNFENPDVSEMSYFGVSYLRVMSEKRIPARDGVSIKYILTKKDGTECVFYEYSDGEHEYIESPGVGVFRLEHDRDHFSSDLKRYYDSIYTEDFSDKAADKSFTLPENYGGDGKAIWIDLSDDHQWWDRFIPDEFIASDPSQVRYLVVCYLDSSTYAGYWYNAETGEKTSDYYEKTYSLCGFDLLTGEETLIVGETDDVFDVCGTEVVAGYFEGK